MRTKTKIYAAIVVALGLGAAGSAVSAIGGDASQYNVFIFGSGTFSSENTDTEGNLAAGGNVSLMNYAVAGDIAGNTSSTPDPARLVVGGTLTAKYGSVGSNKEGAIYINSTPSLTNFADGGVHKETLISSFSADQTTYTKLSSSLGLLKANGTTSGLLAGNTLDFTGTSKGLDVFTVSGATLSKSQTINISAPTGATVLINVTGNSAVSFTNGSVLEKGVSAANVLYNIEDASVYLGSKDPEGSILAPDAGVTGGYGVMHGQLIANSYSGNTQFDNTLFAGSVSAVPLPASGWLFLSGFAGLGAWMRRRGMRLD